MTNTETERSMYLALCTDSEPQWFAVSGKAHLIMTTVTMSGGDHIGSLGLTYTTVHGWSGKSEGLHRVYGQEADKCAKCVAWLDAHPKEVQATLTAHVLETHFEPETDDTDPAESHDYDGGGPDAETDAPKSDPKPKPVKAVKCAVKGTDKVEAVKDTDRDGVTGTCPACHTGGVRLTAKGFIGAHVINNEPVPATPTLSQRSVKAVDTGVTSGDPSDASKRREAEAYTVTGKGKSKTVTPNVPTASQAPIGQRDHGMLDGPAMLPKGTYANGARPDPKVVKEPMHGGRHGYLTRAAYDMLSRSQQRTYWRNVSKRAGK